MDKDMDQFPLIIDPNPLASHASVPLVVYIKGERKIIGEATVNDGEIVASVGSEAGAEILGMIFGSPEKTEFSLDFRHNRFKKKAS